MTAPAPPQVAQDTGCSNCGHRRNEHDRVAWRYCEASAGHERRGCICHGLITTEADARLSFSDPEA
jgi:hypothetical protein